MNEESLVSVIIPFYKTHKEIIEKCIHSVVNQTYKNLEILIIDDGSGNEYDSTINSIRTIDDRIRIYRLKQNMGLSVARNIGLQECKGEYVLFSDSDDLLSIYAIEDLYNALIEQAGDIAIGGISIINNYDLSVILKKPPLNIIELNKIDALDILLTNRGFGSTACCRLASKDIWLKGGSPFIAGIYHEDLASMWNVINSCEKIVWCNSSYYYYYQGGNSSIHTKTVPVKFVKDFYNALLERNEKLKSNIRQLSTAIAFSYLIMSPQIYVYAKQLKNNTDKKEYCKVIRIIFNQNYKNGINYKLAEKKQLMQIKLFRFNPQLYVILYYINRKLRRKRI